jgi:acetyl esterase/lipase
MTVYVIIKANFAQNFGFESEQYQSALRVATTVHKRVGDSGLIFTGHSLGGGLASAASLQTGRQGFTFNAAGLHRNTVGGSIDRQAAKGLIRAYYSASDPLNKWQDKMPNMLNQAVGRRISVSGAEGHSMQSMYEALRGGN